MRKGILTIMVILFSLVLVGCGEADMEGIVLEVTDNKVKVATELTAEDYEAIKDQTVSQIQNEDVYGDSHRGLMDLTYDETEKLSKGDEVEIWLDGDIMTSYPATATAKKIIIKK